jgi:hypothetical protein
VHAIFVFTAAAWLLVTTLIGLLLVYNFTTSVLPQDSLYYLSLHAHIGIVGWFLLLITGVGSRLIPMFLISKYNHPKRLWTIYFLFNGALLGFVLIFFSALPALFYFLPVAAILLALVLFGMYIHTAYQQRIRRQVDGQMQLSLLSVGMMALPLVCLLVILLGMLVTANQPKLVLTYGFTFFFGWLTAIILAMTFKTLPFIVWNKVYHDKAGWGKTPNPKELLDARLFNGMGIVYLAGFVVFVTGILMANTLVLKAGTLLLLLTAISFNWNVLKTLRHKALLK